MIRRPPRSTLDRSSAASDVYKRQRQDEAIQVVRLLMRGGMNEFHGKHFDFDRLIMAPVPKLSLIHISEPTRPY